MITRPLELESRMSPPPRDLDFVAWVNVGVIVLFFSLLGSRFVLAPGLLVGLGEPGAVELPNIGAASHGYDKASVVVSFRSDRVILFDGGMYSLSELRKHMAGYIKNHPGAVMLVKADRQVSVQAFADLSEMARSVGFEHVILGGDLPGPQQPSK